VCQRCNLCDDRNDAVDPAEPPPRNRQEPKTPRSATSHVQNGLRRSNPRTYQNATPYAPCIEHQIVVLLELGTRAKDIPKLIEPPVSYTKVLKVKRNLRNWGAARAPRIIAQGPTPKITAAMGEALDKLLLIKSSHYVDEMVRFIWDEFNILVTESTVNFALFPLFNHTRNRWSSNIS
jgi:hypothetical protein